MGELKSPDKPFEISKWAVKEAWEKVKANKGAPGVDGVSIEEFEADLQGNLYKVWNRMSSGTWFPPPVRAVEIPKPHGGGTRMLGVPTIADRVAQTVVAEELVSRVEAIFHDDSYGYRPGRSALDAVGACRQRCWKTDWVIDLDIQKFFDSVSWDLVVKAVEANTDLPWVLLYVRRWLHAPVQLADGTLQHRDRVPRRGRRRRRCWRTCSCTMRLTRGWSGSSRPCGSNAMSTTRSCTASASAKPARCWPRCRTGWSRSGCGCIPTRRGSSTATTGGGMVPSSTRRSPSSATRFGRAGRGPRT